MSKSKLRDCPAVNRAISTQECGENRGTKWACPAECPHFPFTPANYDVWLEKEDKLIAAVIARALGELPEDEASAFARRLATIPNSLHSQSVCARRFFHERDAAGRTMLDRWEAAGWAGLGTDLAYLLSHQRTMRPALLEVRGVLDDRRILVVDLLGDAEKTFILIDRSMAASVGRFSTYISWIYEMPHGARACGCGLAIHEQGEMSPVEVVAELLRHLGAPEESGPRAEWLGEHIQRVATAYAAVLAARWQDTVRHIDARYTKTEYRVRGRGLGQRLAAQSSMAPEPPAANERAEGLAKGWVWFEDDAPESPADQLALPLTSATPRIGAGRPVLGRVLIGKGRARIEAGSSARHAELRARFEKLAGADATFVSERTDDLGGQILASQPRDYDPALVPPRLLENPQRLHIGASRVAAEDLAGPPGEARSAAVLRHQYATFADEPMPALDGLTPRAASHDPALRPRLVRLMRTHVRMADELAVREGFSFDLNPLLADLGLDEIIVPPPPLRAPLPDEDGEDFNGEAAAAGEIAGLATAPPNMNEDDVFARLAAINALPFLTPVVERMEDEAGTFMLGIESRSHQLNDAEFNLLTTQIARAYAVLVPRPHPLRGADKLDAMFQRELRELVRRMPETSTDTRNVLTAMLEGPQPNLAAALIAETADFGREAPRKDRPRKNCLHPILLILRAAIAVLDRAIVR